MRSLAALFLSALVVGSVVAQPVVKKTSPGWTNDLTKALSRAKKEKKLVLVDFTATWCGPCQMYKRQVFPTKEFKAAAKDFILVEIDTDDQPRVARAYAISGIPDIRLLTPEGKQLDKIVGFDPDRLLQSMAKAQKNRKK
jgi:thiol:disulfide interchange protein